MVKRPTAKVLEELIINYVAQFLELASPVFIPSGEKGVESRTLQAPEVDFNALAFGHLEFGIVNRAFHKCYEKICDVSAAEIAAW